MTLITPEWLRSRDFRIEVTSTDNRPHMVLPLDRKIETALEISESPGFGWVVWLRSDIAHSRCRFVFCRNVETTDQVERLVLGLTDRPLVDVPWDPEQFSVSWKNECEDCKRRYAEYCRGERYGRVPG